MLCSAAGETHLKLKSAQVGLNIYEALYYQSSTLSSTRYRYAKRGKGMYRKCVWLERAGCEKGMITRKAASMPLPILSSLATNRGRRS